MALVGTPSILLTDEPARVQRMLVYAAPRATLYGKWLPDKPPPVREIAQMAEHGEGWGLPADWN